jgi:ubiquitin-conjugating enzyme E2 variant
VLGPLLIEPFRDHHRDPLGITRHGFVELSGNSALATLPVAGTLLWWGPPEEDVVSPFVHAGVTALAMALFATNLFHRWAHMPRPPAAAAWLQRSRLVLPPSVHAVHHRAAHDCSYCVTSGWLNPLLDRIGFFSRVERGLAALGLDPMRGPVPDPRPVLEPRPIPDPRRGAGAS